MRARDRLLLLDPLEHFWVGVLLLFDDQSSSRPDEFVRSESMMKNSVRCRFAVVDKALGPRVDSNLLSVAAEHLP